MRGITKAFLCLFALPHLVRRLCEGQRWLELFDPTGVGAVDRHLGGKNRREDRGHECRSIGTGKFTKVAAKFCRQRRRTYKA